MQFQADSTTELRNNIYSITGKFKGKSIAKTVKSKGYTRNKRTVKYESFRPDNINNGGRSTRHRTA